MRQSVRHKVLPLSVLGLAVIAGCSTESGAGPDTSSVTSPTSPASPTSATGPTSPAEPTGTAGSPRAGASSSPSPARTSPSASTPSADVVVDVVLSNGKVTPNGATIKVRTGQTVLLTGSGDTKDSLHLHGYDKSLDITPGRKTNLVFTADTPGVFELETHESDKLVAKLQVS